MIVAMTGIPVVAKVRHGDQELAMDAANWLDCIAEQKGRR